MDNTIVDLTDGILGWMNSELKNPKYQYQFPIDLKRNQITEFDVWKNWKLPESIGTKLREQMFNTPGFWHDLPPIKGSIQSLKNLQSRYNIYVSTKPIYNDVCVSEKIDWIKVHLPFINQDNVVFSRDKGILLGDAMVDDEPSHLLKFQGKRLLFMQPYNQSYWHAFNYCASEWHEMESILSGHF
jgi:5'(3')-deoxyribonucleotidase